MCTQRYLLGLTFFYSATVLSGTVGPVMVEPYNGFYLGGTVGVANLLDKESTLYAPGLYDRHQLSAIGFVGGGLLGYDYGVTDYIKLGLEGFINGAALNVAAEQLYSPLVSYNADMRYSTGVRVLPGYQFYSGAIGHILLGYAYGKFNIKDDGNYGFINQGISKSGFQSGLGINVPCYFKNLSLRGDLIYTTYGSNTSLGLSTDLTPQNYYNKFATIEGNLSLIYKI